MQDELKSAEEKATQASSVLLAKLQQVQEGEAARASRLVKLKKRSSKAYEAAHAESQNALKRAQATGHHLDRKAYIQAQGKKARHLADYHQADELLGVSIGGTHGQTR